MVVVVVVGGIVVVVFDCGAAIDIQLNATNHIRRRLFPIFLGRNNIFVTVSNTDVVFLRL